ncbi:MAG: hypothetical protein IJG62_00825 [Synergistaceae bacterium]|nr:hypothetical protein [Synergistaceae bacterium]MBR0043272.1 hypothetical protein [Synergistaceae bacterium]
MSEAYSKNIADAVGNALNEEELNFSFDDENGVFAFNLGIEGPINNLNFFIEIGDDRFLVYAVPPIAADVNNSSVTAAIAEFICRANYGMPYGNFELNVDDGEIRYKVFVQCDDITPNKDLVIKSVYHPVLVFERYSPGITAVLFGSANPAEQIQKCEAAE